MEPEQHVVQYTLIEIFFRLIPYPKSNVREGRNVIAKCFFILAVLLHFLAKVHYCNSCYAQQNASSFKFSK